MSLPDDLAQLDSLRQRGVLTDDEFARAKARLLGDAPAGSPAGPAVAAVNGLRRPLQGRWLGGVCAGIARSTGVAAWAWRLLFVLLLTCGGVGALLYVLMWVLVPEDEALASPPAPPASTTA